MTLTIAELHASDRIGDLAGHKFHAAQRRFMVEQDAADAENVVGFTIIDGHPVGV